MFGVSKIFQGKLLGTQDHAKAQEAEAIIFQGIEILEELQTKAFSVGGYFALGELYANTEQKNKAVEYFQRAEAMYRDMGMDFFAMKTHKALEGLRG